MVLRQLLYQPDRDPGWYHDFFSAFFDSNEGVTWLARPNREKKLGGGKWTRLTGGGPVKG